MKKYIILLSMPLLYLLLLTNVKAEEPISNNDEFQQLAENNTPSVYYKSHVQNYGWQDYVSNGEMSGTHHQSKRLESFRIYLDSEIEGSILYKSHVQDYGWEDDWRQDNALTGTEHQSKRLEAIRIKLSGLISEQYDVYYRVHAQNYGWLGWAKNGEVAGSLGYSKRLEAIEIKLVKKGEEEPTGDSYRAPSVTIRYQTHIQSIGWQNVVENNGFSGTTGRGLRMECLRAKVAYSPYSGNVSYSSYIEGKGWENESKTNFQDSGTTGKSLRIEAVKMNLTGELADYYDIYYRVHLRDYGWLGWAKNGEVAGNIGETFRIEAIEIKLLEKGDSLETGQSYIEKQATLYYQSHVQSIGDMTEVSEGKITGTTGRSLRLEAFRVRVESDIAGNVLYQSYVENSGWENNWKNAGEMSGTSHQSKALNLIRIKLDGDLAEKYDIYYRVHSEIYGWLGWAKNGEEAGVTCYDIQAIEIKLYLKSDSDKNKLNTANHYIVSGFYQENGYTYYKDKNGVNADDWITIMSEKYFFNSLGVMIGRNVKKVIDVSAWQGDIDWDVVKNTKDVDGVILRIGAGRVEDTKLERNISELKRLNIPYGIYIYSYAENYTEGREYAEFTVDMIRKYDMNPTIGIYFDLESNKITQGLGVADYESIVGGFMEVMTSNGYGLNTKIYTYKNYADTALNSSYLRDQITWIAQYNHFCYYSGSYVGWQYSSTERVAGVSGDVDASVWFTSF